MSECPRFLWYAAGVVFSVFSRVGSGLVDALQVLKGVNGIAQCYFTEKDVVRHRLVQEIIKAYEAAAHPAKH